MPKNKNKINLNKRKIRNKNQNRKINKKINKRFRRRNQRRIAAAYVKNFKKSFNVLRQTGTTMRVKGKDLIYKIPDNLINQTGTNVIAIIPSNPAYWTGTRMAAISSGYQNYRPIKFNVIYVPQCAVTQQGNVLAGTLWAMSPTTENLQQTLRTSNGGLLTQCYKGARSRVDLGSNLQFNLFRMGGKFDQESNPFIFIALGIATIDNNNNLINPGYFYVDYEYELKNPIGDTIKYYNSGLIYNKDVQGGYINSTLINCSNQNINIGAIIQKDGDTYTWNDDEIQINDQDLVWYFSNQIDNEALKRSSQIKSLVLSSQLIESSILRVNGDEVKTLIMKLSNTSVLLLIFSNRSEYFINFPLSIYPLAKYLITDEDSDLLVDNYNPVLISEVTYESTDSSITEYYIDNLMIDLQPENLIKGEEEQTQK